MALGVVGQRPSNGAAQARISFQVQEEAREEGECREDQDAKLHVQEVIRVGIRMLR